MKFGFNLPGTLDGKALLAFASRADELGFESIWSGDHIILPTAGTNQYPYTIDGSFQRPADAPYHEMMTVLSFVAGATERVRIGSTVIILPYRDPVVQAKMFSSLDVLTNGRVICGVGVGWLEKEFDTLRVPYADRGPMSDECLEVMRCLWTEDEPEYHGRFFDFDGIQMYPKPVQKPHIPIWVGGHTGRALRRTAKYGDAWHPTRQTPDYVAAMLPRLANYAEQAGRDAADITISLKRSLFFTDLGLSESGGVRTGGALIASTREIVDDALRCREIGIDQLTFDFRTPDPGDCIRTIEHFAEKVAPALE